VLNAHFSLKEAATSDDLLAFEAIESEGWKGAQAQAGSTVADIVSFGSGGAGRGGVAGGARAA